MRGRPSGSGRAACAAVAFLIGAFPVAVAGQGRPTVLPGRVELADAPRATLLYQNFPNPFPSDATATTCIWFDLHVAAPVRLTVHDIRGTPVRVLVPSTQVASSLAAGRYGRAREASNAGCDPRFSWDGTDNAGRRVAAGVYLVRLETPSYRGTKKALFVGR